MLKMIGKVKKVFLNKIIVTLNNKEDFFQLYNGDVYWFDGINQYIIVKRNDYEKLVFQIICLYEDEKPYILEESSKFKSEISLEAIPIGTIINNVFQFGITSYPMISDEVVQMSSTDLENIFSIINSDKYIQIGELNQFKGYFPKIDIDKLFSNHMCILGNTGSGKSTTIRNILYKLCMFMNKDLINKNLNFYIFDVHKEYKLNSEISNEISINDISIPVKNLTKEDWINLVIPSSATQLPVLTNALKLGYLLRNDNLIEKYIKIYLAKLVYNSQQTDAVAKRAKILFLLENINDKENKLQDILKYYSSFGSFQVEENGRINKDKSLEIENEFKTLLEELLHNYIEFIKKNNANNKFYDNISKVIKESKSNNSFLEQILKLAECKIDDISDLKKGLELSLLMEECKNNTQIRSYCSSLVLRVENLVNEYSKTLFSNNSVKLQKYDEMIGDSNITDKKGIQIIDCSELENEDLNFFTSYILNQIYEKAKQERKSNIYNIYNFIFDEAHRYISENKQNDFFNPIKVFEKISKEGRKFGIFMIIASQRPYELSSTVLSQCNNYLLHRIRNNIDLEQIRKSIPYISDNLLNRLSFLESGVILGVGEAFAIPLELKIDNKNNSKISETPMPSLVWFS